ncbi:MAG: hypothetical protein ACFFAN_07215 [Promethearchaeota archaeon]
MVELIENERLNRRMLKETRENIILRKIFENNEFFITNWNRDLEEKYKIPKNSLYNIIKSLIKQKLIIRKSLKPIRVTFTPKISNMLLIIEDNGEIPLKELEQNFSYQELPNIVEKLIDAEIIKKFTKNLNIYLKMIP